MSNKIWVRDSDGDYYECDVFVERLIKHKQTGMVFRANPHRDARDYEEEGIWEFFMDDCIGEPS